MSSATPKPPTTLVISLWPGAGFFSSFNCVVNHLHHSLGRNGVAAIYVDWRARPRLNSFPYGTEADGNLWEQFFEPLAFDTYPETIARKGFFADHRMTNFLAYLRIYKLRRWRRAYHRVLAKYIRLKPRLRAAIDRFYAERLRGHYCVGVHYRNVRHSLECPERIPSIVEFIQRTRRLIHGHADARVFLATDVEEAVELFQWAFGDQLVYQAGVVRASRDGDLHSHHRRQDASVSFGEQVVTDCYLLARCDVLLHITSNVATAAACINPALKLVYCERSALGGLCRYGVKRVVNLVLAVATRLNRRRSLPRRAGAALEGMTMTKALAKRLFGRLAIRDLLQVLAGHSLRYRHPRRSHLRALAMAYFSRPRAAAVSAAWMINGSMRLRRWARTHTYLRWRYTMSRVRWMLRRSQPHVDVSASGTAFSLLCPSRGRVQNARSLIESVHRTAARPERVELLFYVDADDPSLAGYQRLFAEAERRFSRLKRCALIVGEPMTVSRAWNVLARAAEGDVLKLVNDDVVFVDYGWDERAASELALFPDGIVCMFFDAGQYRSGGDFLAGQDRYGGDFPMVPRRWFEALGYFTPELFEFWSNETWMMDIAERLGRLHPIKGILLDHLHYSRYLSPCDETYRRHHFAADQVERDAAMFRLTAGQRKADAHRLRRLIDTNQTAGGALRSSRPAIA